MFSCDPPRMRRVEMWRMRIGGSRVTRKRAGCLKRIVHRLRTRAQAEGLHVSRRWCRRLWGDTTGTPGRSGAVRRTARCASAPLQAMLHSPLIRAVLQTSGERPVVRVEMAALRWCRLQADDCLGYSCSRLRRGVRLQEWNGPLRYDARRRVRHPMRGGESVQGRSRTSASHHVRRDRRSVQTRPHSGQTSPERSVKSYPHAQVDDEAVLRLSHCRSANIVNATVRIQRGTDTVCVQYEPPAMLEV